MRQLRRLFDSFQTIEHAVTAYLEEKYGICLTKADWQDVVVERALPILMAKSQADALLRGENKPADPPESNS